MTNRELYARVKAAFIARHDEPINSLNKWCLANGVHRQNARGVLLGQEGGNWAAQLRARLVIAAGMSVDVLADISNDDMA